MKFIGFDPFIRQNRTDKGFRVEINVSQDQYDQIKDLVKLQEKILEIEINEQPGQTETN
jgi:hypothetical protein